MPIQPGSESPEGRAWFFSRWSYHWVNPLLVQGFSSLLSSQALWKLPDYMTAAQIEGRFVKYWDKHKKRSRDGCCSCYNFRLATALYRACWPFYFKYMLICRFLVTMLAFVPPILVRELLSYLARPDSVHDWRPHYYAYILAGLVAVVAFVTASLNHAYYWLAVKAALSVKTALVCAVVDKALKLDLTEKTRYPNSAIVNFTTTDADNIMTYAWAMIDDIWACVLSLTVAMSLLFYILGKAAFGGLGVLVLMLLLTRALSKITARMQEALLVASDARIAATTTFVSSMKLIKLYGWEAHFVKEVLDKRRVQESLLTWLNIVESLQRSMSKAGPLFVSLVTFALYAIEDHQLNAATAFAALMLLNAIRDPLSRIPVSISCALRAHASQKRIAMFLEAREKERSVLFDPSIDHHSIAGNFCWSLPLPPQPNSSLPSSPLLGPSSPTSTTSPAPSTFSSSPNASSNPTNNTYTNTNANNVNNKSPKLGPITSIAREQKKKQHGNGNVNVNDVDPSPLLLNIKDSEDPSNETSKRGSEESEGEGEEEEEVEDLGSLAQAAMQRAVTDPSDRPQVTCLQNEPELLGPRPRAHSLPHGHAHSHGHAHAHGSSSPSSGKTPRRQHGGLAPTLAGLDLKLKKGSLTMVVGQVGSGKSSLLMALLGEMQRVDQAEVRLACTQDQVAYSPQQPWLLTASIRDNIVFGNPFNAEWYLKTLYACALLRDLELLPDGDLTEIGESGVGLSGGQKARVSLARAVYSKPAVLLLDEPLSAVDAHVGSWLWDQCIGPRGLLATHPDKFGNVATRILCTHQVQFAAQADQIIVLANGAVTHIGTHEDLTTRGVDLGFYAAEPEKEPDKKAGEKPAADGNPPPDRHDNTTEVPIGDSKNERNPNVIEPRDSPNTTNQQQHALVPKIPYFPPETLRLSQADFPMVGSSDHTVKHPKQTAHTESNPLSPSNISTANDNTLILDDDDLHSMSVDNHSLAGVSAAIISAAKNNMTSNAAETQPGKREVRKMISIEKFAGKNTTAYSPYFNAGGHSIIWVLLAILAGLSQLVSVFCDFFLAYWSAYGVNARSVPFIPKTPHPGQVSEKIYYISWYGYLVAACSVLFLIRFLFLGFVCERAGRTLHNKYFIGVVNAPQAFFDSTPLGRILSRGSKDQDLVDTQLPGIVQDVMLCFVALVAPLAIVVSLAVVSLGPIAGLCVIYYLVQTVYRRTAIQLKRLEANSRAPIASHIAEALEGQIPIRAHNCQERFLAKGRSRIDDNCHLYFYSFAVNRWLGVRLEAIGAVAVLSATILAVYFKQKLGGGMIGVMVTSTLTMSGNLNWMVRQFSELESNLNSVERLVEYGDLPPEEELVPAPTYGVVPRRPATKPNKKVVVPPKTWPQRGHIRLQSVSVAYRVGLPWVLKEVSVEVAPGEKVGIVGRTGAGKSSLSLALFRVMPLDALKGAIFIDQYNIFELPLINLRTKLSIIPQEPVLFPGTIRSNLDPFSESTDEQIWKVLGQIQLRRKCEELWRQQSDQERATAANSQSKKSKPKKRGQKGGDLAKPLLAVVQEEEEDKDVHNKGGKRTRIPVLSATVEYNGENFSVGQRQLFCLGRALLRNSRVVVLDEATASLDFGTDVLMRRIIKEHFQHCTVLTIAHRLDTILDSDKIMVFDSGRIVEFGSPKDLAARGGTFAGLLRQARSSMAAMDL